MIFLFIKHKGYIVIVFLFCLSFFQAYAANYDVNPEDNRFNFEDGPQSFILYGGGLISDRNCIKTLMDAKGFPGNEYQHFLKIAVNENLTGEQKLEAGRVVTEYFKGLENENKKEINNLLESLLKHKEHEVYTLRRLFITACVRIGAGLEAINRGPALLKMALVNNDPSLLRIALSCGADPNKKNGNSSPLGYCQSVEMAKIMVNKGASVGEARYGKHNYDLIQKICLEKNFLFDEGKLLSFYLQRMPLNDFNKHGKIWIEGLLLGNSSREHEICQKLRVLLKSNRAVYNKETRNALCEKFPSAEPVFKENDDSGVRPAKRCKIE